MVILESVSEESYLKNLAEDAKWGTDADIQKVSLELLVGYGQKAIPYLEEILTVSTQEEIRQACADAIKRLQNGNELMDASQRKPLGGRKVNHGKAGPGNSPEKPSRQVAKARRKGRATDGRR